MFFHTGQPSVLVLVVSFQLFAVIFLAILMVKWKFDRLCPVQPSTLTSFPRCPCSIKTSYFPNRFFCRQIRCKNQNTVSINESRVQQVKLLVIFLLWKQIKWMNIIYLLTKWVHVSKEVFFVITNHRISPSSASFYIHFQTEPPKPICRAKYDGGQLLT